MSYETERHVGKSLTQSITILFLTLFLHPAPSAKAGAGPSQWVVVVNADSIPSRTVANHFCKLRNIPANNIIVLSGIPNTDRIAIEEFRSIILLPILKQIESRKLSGHIQGVAYSVDFPTSIDIAVEADKIPNRSQYLTPVASINGLTYFYRLLLSQSPAYVGFDSNFYAARPTASLLNPFIPNQQKFEALSQHVRNMEWEPAATILDEEIKAMPRDLRATLFVVAAQLWAKADQPEKVLDRLESAALAGWEYREAIEKEKLFESLKEDHRMQRILKLCKDRPFDFTPTRGFDARTHYAPNSLATKDPKFGLQFLLSMMLGVSRDQGITETEVIIGLKRSIGADYTQPRGAFIFSKTDDVRTTTRLPFFEMAINKLKSKGFEARIIQDPLPRSGDKCSGLMIGTPNFVFAASRAELLPGCIAENLTSLGGAMTDTSQTKATELIRFGAAASSGAVTEPYSIINKFPNPMIHHAYTDGLTVAEAFYSSVLSPYQLLILGDPLCQPYAKPIRFEIDEYDRIHDRKKPLNLRLKPKDADAEPESVVCLVDGKFISEILYEPTFSVNLADAPLGAHEFRFLVKSELPIQHCSEQSIWVHLLDAPVSSEPKAILSWECAETFKISENKPLPFRLTGVNSGNEIEVIHHSEILATIPGDATEIPLKLRDTGYGPVRLQLRQKDLKGNPWSSEPRFVLVTP